MDEKTPRKGKRTNQKYRNLAGSDQQMQRLEETELRKTERTVEVNCYIFSKLYNSSPKSYGQPFKVLSLNKQTLIS